MPSRKRESERKGNPLVNTGRSPFSDECTNTAVEEVHEPARGSGSLHTLTPKWALGSSIIVGATLATMYLWFA
ncbi:hypothetical protein T07_9312 [Trichinella nelsoni]|uniref:Uncharacterized protein n=1 Tax=Trichinella nelsoni TaxID=6336 RepID=A0A0V0RNX6_9BILA|nr:hypothetical protein T07_9312 [Trichinella nelsoni]